MTYPPSGSVPRQGMGAPDDSRADEQLRDQPRSRSDQAREATGAVAGTAKDQAASVAGDARSQARAVTDRVKSTVGDQMQSQTRRLSSNLHRWADDLAAMADHAQSESDTTSPAHTRVRSLADRGHRAADYIDGRGPQGMVDDVQDWARHNPVAFLAGAAAAGFVMGRIARSARGNGAMSSTDTPDTTSSMDTSMGADASSSDDTAPMSSAEAEPDPGSPMPGTRTATPMGSEPMTERPGEG